MVPTLLGEKPILANLPKFLESQNEDLAAHVESYEEFMISSPVSDQGYYLVWYPSTLVDTTYFWYRSHETDTFTK